MRTFSPDVADVADVANVIGPDYTLTAAVNVLRMAWYRHAGGALGREDRGLIELAALLCLRALDDGVPAQAGGIGSLEGVAEANLLPMGRA